MSVPLAISYEIRGKHKNVFRHTFYVKRISGVSLNKRFICAARRLIQNLSIWVWQTISVWSRRENRFISSSMKVI